MRYAGDWQLYSSAERCAVVIENTKNFLFSKLAGVRKALDEVRIIGLLRLACSHPQESAINQDRNFNCHNSRK